MKATTTIYDVGTTRHGQRITLEEGRDGWALVQHASSQRDETQRIYVTQLIAAAILGAFQ